MTRWAKAGALAFVGIVAMGGINGCASAGRDRGSEAGGDSIGQTVSPAEILECGARTITLDDGSSETVPEWYVPRAMNAKLRLYPDFAAAARMTSAWTCEAARALFDAYEIFSHEHPGFDANQPVDSPFDAPPMPPLVSDPRTYRKVAKQEGTHKTAPDPGRKLGRNPAIVAVAVDLGPGPGGTNGGLTMPGTGPNLTDHCTGTFIAKNWVLTAAHCLSSVTGIAKMTAAGTFKTNPAWGWWGFMPADDNGQRDNAHYFECQHTLGIADSRYMGFRAGEPQSTSYDLALLYILPECDEKMPVLPDGTPAVMAFATNNDIFGTTDDEQWWGFGAHLANPTDPTVIDTVIPYELSHGDTQNFAASGHPYPDFLTEKADHQAAGWLPPFNTAGAVYDGPFPCVGDSGGPIVATVNAGQGGTFAGQQVINALLSAFVSPTVANAKCATHIGTDYGTWSPTSESATFIRTQLRRWNAVHDVPKMGDSSNPLACTALSVAGSPSAGVLMCQSDPCFETDDCCMNSENFATGHGSHNCETGDGTTRWFCQHPGAALDDEGATCSTSGANGVPGEPVCPSGGCDCVRGQCLPLPAELR